MIADLSEMEAQVNVDENDIVSIAIGQPAEIEVDALLDQRAEGHRPRDQQQREHRPAPAPREQKTEFEIKIGITDSAEDAAPGHDGQRGHRDQDQRPRAERAAAVRRAAHRRPARRRRARSARTPRRATSPTGTASSRSCSCIEKGKAVAQQVKTGIQSDELIEILDGLKEGDEVVTGSYRAISKDLENGAVVKINNEKTPEKAESDQRRGSRSRSA